MRMLPQVALLLAGLGAASWGQPPLADVVAAVRAGWLQQRDDQEIARLLRKLNAAERMDSHTIDILRGEGAGPLTLAELERLRKRSAALPSPAPPVVPEGAEHLWEAARLNALHYTSQLPDFVCDEVVRRYTREGRRAAWRPRDTLQFALTYFDHLESYQLISGTQEEGTFTEGEFGSLLASVFSAKMQTRQSWDYATTLRGRATSVFAFAIDAAHSNYHITAGTPEGPVHITAGQLGAVFIDDATARVVRITAAAVDIPAGFPVQAVNVTLDYDFVDVGGEQQLLPLSSETVMEAPPWQNRNQITFLHYRKFTANTTITFEGERR